ncbi:MAG: hypothetical protein KF760_25320 [Candidatus Eremiobacteraeota bacterium]|nr:hypothetical protein [Candidatus Eremiobacteraeota bacterium]MCW5871446.1 hypothetical protein [Candidatus Eremiobacteraeota bacterium]
MLKASQITLLGIGLGTSSDLALSKLSSSASQCWVTDDNLYLLRSDELSLLANEEKTIVSIDDGRVLEIDGTVVLRSGDPETIVRMQFGTPESTVSIDKDGCFELWEYRMEQAVLSFLISEKRVESISLKRSWQQ